jgi:hypothetical protein
VAAASASIWELTDGGNTIGVTIARILLKTLLNKKSMDVSERERQRHTIVAKNIVQTHFHFQNDHHHH